MIPSKKYQTQFKRVKRDSKVINSRGSGRVASQLADPITDLSKLITCNEPDQIIRFL